jgi:hypothetical protein
MVDTLSSDLSVLSFGAAGGVSAEVLHWYGLRRNRRVPIYAKSIFYWVVTLAMVLVGALLAWVRYGSNGAPFDVFFVGLAAPIILQKLIAHAPAGVAGSRGSPSGIRDFFVW